jgi:hypothetical protein
LLFNDDVSTKTIYSTCDRTINEYGAADGMIIGRRNRSTRSKPAPVPFCPPEIIPHDLTWDGPRAAVMGSRRLESYYYYLKLEFFPQCKYKTIVLLQFAKYDNFVSYSSDVSDSKGHVTR